MSLLIFNISIGQKMNFYFEVSCFLQVAQFAVYQMLVSTIFPVFFSLYLGAWCDLFGRKLLFKIYLSARCMDQIIVILCAYFVNSPKEYLLLAKIPSSLAGTQKYLSKRFCLNFLDSAQKLENYLSKNVPDLIMKCSHIMKYSNFQKLLGKKKIHNKHLLLHDTKNVVHIQS